MENDEDEGHQQQPSTPFWLKNTTFQSSKKRTLPSFSSILFNSTSVILLLLVATALIFIFFFIPSILNFTSQIFRPNSVKRSWDSLNLVLILFAIICAFLGRTNNNENPNTASDRFSSPSPSYKYREREPELGEYSVRMSRLRSSSSYPDLRQHEYTTSPISPWVSADYTDRSSSSSSSSNWVSNAAYRFSDDTQLRSYQFTEPGWHINTKSPPVTEVRSTKTVDDKAVENPKPVEEASPQHLPTPVSSQPPPPSQLPFNPLPEKIPTRVHPKSKRTHRIAERHEEANPTPLAPPRSPTRAAASTVRRKKKRANRSFDDAFESRDDEQQQRPQSLQTQAAETDPIERKKSGGATKDFLASFYGKKKRGRQRSSENYDLILLNRPIATPPPPPPPPPPPSVFGNLFSTKKSKGKKSSSATDTSESITSKSRYTNNNATTKIAMKEAPIPTQSTKSTSYNNSRGNESPLYGIPEPPPLPPFGMPVWKFVVEGDYVRLKSMNSSRSGSPDPEDESIRASSENGESMRSEIDDVDEDEERRGVSASETDTAAFCPSPDVNTKADNFIARFRAGLKMEKVNSGKGVGLSRLGPNTNINNLN